MALQVYLLGTVEFEAALALQRLLAYQVAGERGLSALILCEHPPIITIGREGSRAQIRCEPEELRLRRWAVRWVNRGGGCILHLPGQLAIYPILPLHHFGLGVQSYLSRLQCALAGLLGDFEIESQTRLRQTGLWVGNRLLADVGVAVRDWVSYFGAVLNINPDLEPFRLIANGGPGDGPMTSLERERRGPLRPALVRERFLEHFTAHFSFTRTTLFFQHPFLDRKQRSDTVHANP
jgi:lipoyl(octanoyl) transferase